MTTWKKLLIIPAALAALLATTAGACDDSTPAKPGTDIANNRQNYTPKNDVEGHNYNARQTIADNPSTLIWCTAYPTSPNAKAFTVPIVGKLTSGNKRPYATSQAGAGGGSGWTYTPEVAGPDGMYGTSGEYRYGFDPAGNYHDFYNLETYCTTVPNIVQKEQTTIIVKADTDLNTIDQKVEKALAECRKKDPDPSHSCPAAAALIGA